MAMPSLQRRLGPVLAMGPPVGPWHFLFITSAVGNFLLGGCSDFGAPPRRPVRSESRLRFLQSIDSTREKCEELRL